MIRESSFKSAWWLPNAHAQTVYPTLMRKRVAPIDKMERLELPDGDFIELAWAINGLGDDTPVVVLLHGLGGSIQSAYVGGLLQAFNRFGWRGVLMLFRGAGSELNRLPRAYHSGDTHDLNCFMESLVKREPHTKKAIVGVSLGGNVLLKWFGELGQQTFVETGVAVSVPFQLRLAADRMNRGISRVYQSYLLKEMRELFKRIGAVHGQELQPFNHALDTCRCFWTFDDRITAPLHGFSNVHAYYREASSRQYLSKIMTPTLIIHALDDPFMTPDILPASDDLSSMVTLEVSQKGGHVGFITGHLPGKPVYWLDERIPSYLKTYLS